MPACVSTQQAIVVIAALGLRAVLVRPPFEEADAFARAERYLLAHMAPGDPILQLMGQRRRAESPLGGGSLGGA